MADQSNLQPPKPADPRPFLERPVAVVGIVAGIFTIASFFFTSWVETPDNDSPQTRVDACMTAHGLSNSIVRTETAPGQVFFRGCVWPPPLGAELDGLTEIAVASLDGPGQSEAEGLTIVDVFTSSCRTIEVRYLFASQGSFSADQPIRLQVGEMRRVEGGSIWMPRNEPEASRFSPRRDQSVILGNTRYELDTARCID